MIGSLSKSELFATLPAPWAEDLLPRIRDEVAKSRRKVVVLDDDPTGTQTVRGVPVLTEWSANSLRAELVGDAPGFFILTNSRAYPEKEAVRLSEEIGRNLTLAAGKDARFVVVSRSDSTLRGHFPAEVDALAGALAGGHSAGASGRAHLPPVLLVPYFEAGGRYTVNNIHYVAEGDRLIPAAETPFAQDAAFGYSNSDLRAWVEEKMHGRVKASQVVSVSLADIRGGGPHAVRGRLMALQPGDVCVINAAAPRDLDVVALACIEAEAAGARIFYRTAASFVAARLGQEPGSLWRPKAGIAAGVGGLTVVGSYVPKTTTQLAHLLSGGGLESVELAVTDLLGPERKVVVARAVERVNELLKRGRNAVVFTSRDLVSGTDAVASLKIGGQVSAALVEVVARLSVQPRYLIAKGGITSSDLATQGLGVKRAMVLGQILPGVPVWELGPETRFPGLPYVVFPGNVGGPQALAEAVAILKSKEEKSGK